MPIQSNTFAVNMARQITQSVAFYDPQPTTHSGDSHLMAAYMQYANTLVEAISWWRELVQRHCIQSKSREELAKAAEKEEGEWMEQVDLDPSLL